MGRLGLIPSNIQRLHLHSDWLYFLWHAWYKWAYTLDFEIWHVKGIHDAKHSFLIRDPKKSISSIYRVMKKAKIRNWVYFDPDEAGFKELYALYDFVKEKLDAQSCSSRRG